MRAVAFCWVYNEADIIGHVVRHLLKQQIHVYIFDNWSSDSSAKVALDAASKLHRPITIDKWPLYEPTTVSWAEMLRHTEEVALAMARDIGSFWCLHHDADEFRYAPGYSPNENSESLHDFLYRIQLVGWNAVDHHVTVYAPADGYDPDQHDPRTYFSQPLADHIDNHNSQIKVWWQTPTQRVDLATKGGHDVKFSGRRVCPEKLLMHHYPMRGEAQRAAKAKSRAARWDATERAMGWHCAYQS